MYRLEDDILTLKGVGNKTAELFHKLGVYQIADLLLSIPGGFQCYEEPKMPENCEKETLVSIPAVPKAGSYVTKKAGRYQISLVKVISGNRIVTLRFFNMPYIRNVLKAGNSYVLRGIIKCQNEQFSMLQPQIFTLEKYSELQNKLIPCYHLTKGLTNHTFQKACKVALEELEPVFDYLSDDQLKSLNLPSFGETLCSIHMPDSRKDFEKARKRLAFHEFFTFLYLIRKDKDAQEYSVLKQPLLPVADTKRFLEALPYELTGAQKRVWTEIEEDMDKAIPMNRLLQGDVGSGKTIIAFLALLKAAANNKQGVLMAPTEVLAEQHFSSFIKMCKEYKLCIRPVLLLGSMPAKVKRQALEGIMDGTYNVIIGTHAVIQEKVQYKDLALVITDEQHRFGVNQREVLRKKGDSPHVLVMSATPIPRTLALILYGDMSVSIIDELPANRLPIKNCVVNDSYRPTAYNFMQKEMEKGRQVYIICPMVTESEEMDELENVIDYAERLKQIFPKEISIAHLHGKMTLSEKETIMHAFERHEIDILVSTTVVEVGINVPNATIMMVENAERYGLAQLHQLRGRVGRGEHQSYCIFMSGKMSDKNKERLEILNQSNDGFYIANKDLEMRGPGQLSGIAQSGELGFTVADIYRDKDMLVLADGFCNNVISKKESIREELFYKLSLKTDSMADKIMTL